MHKNKDFKNFVRGENNRIIFWYCAFQGNCFTADGEKTGEILATMKKLGAFQKWDLVTLLPSLSCTLMQQAVRNLVIHF